MEGVESSAFALGGVVLRRDQERDGTTSTMKRTREMVGWSSRSEQIENKDGSSLADLAQRNGISRTSHLSSYGGYAQARILTHQADRPATYEPDDCSRWRMWNCMRDDDEDSVQRLPQPAPAMLQYNAAPVA
ncbi:hypothetical protein HETIRDRAFT_104579 [Heterobasidion irregulare TC 32-1]|uniref:Uncharacterized protein n=1 Tax=Heterobasidion irregulare (strain TC 32-1) TaxID=747525 RepID=W4K0I0_HETIT|nr:uncharacterized protein HETIRDRAFT_104579 [Heterobasidion irregulare TC 32-1]ETW79318.1 hypothetical protein HETIRDRAFT_104579 [Heterobasidion irregulare TC 32-1]